MTPQFTKLVVYVEYEGKPFRVMIDKEMQDMAVKMMAACCPEGRLKLAPADAEIKFKE